MMSMQSSTHSSQRGERLHCFSEAITELGDGAAAAVARAANNNV
jgi:hypothetical protein